ncbi:M12 family metallopeptidase [Silvimonas iriomotensis]|uniref:Peptidase M12A domain-containing protein n=1 Tax=Silvimonas iriomotensis TaxID=449662 RepID=A0ABQ2P8D1_9NEIS|nr:M12 family metallopeptidase [Silvimonas iriomotensis]GGP20678.1 hypothetical protein GCM10010970_16410 [Silvimonas iriomotensis]
MTADAFSKMAGNRAIAQKAVKDTWETASLVRFTGWGQCNANSGSAAQLVRVAVEDVIANATKTRVTLNFTFNNFQASRCKGNQQQLEKCIFTETVHEFGHVLGFSHEQNRPDTNEIYCSAEKDDFGGDTIVGAWDIDSVMNYCSRSQGAWMNDGILSKTDIQMVQKYYGTPNPMPDMPSSSAGSFLAPILLIME